MIERLYLVFEILAMLICMHGLYGEKVRWNIYTILFFGFELFVYQINFIYDLPIIVEILAYLVMLLYSFKQFQAGIKKTLSNYVIYIILCVLLQLICYIPAIFLYDKLQLFTGYVINILFLIVVIVLSRTGILAKISRFLFSNDKMMFLVIGFILLLTLFALISIKSNIDINMFDYIMITLSITTIMVSVSMWQNQKLINDHLRREKQLNELYGSALQELIHNIRQKQHDYKNQILAIKGMVYAADSLESLKAEQENFFNELIYEDKYTQLLSKNNEMIISGFLYVKLNEAEKKGIRTYCDVIIDKIENPDIVADIVKIIGILIDNAIEALQGAEFVEKRLSVCIKKRDVLMIEVANVSKYISLESSIKFFERGFSTKGEGRGLGLTNVKELAHKYRGEVQVNNEERELGNWFVITVLLKNKS